MPRKRTDIEYAAGKLISAIQKEYVNCLDDLSDMRICDSKRDLAHDFLQARNKENIIELLQGRTVSEYIGEAWLKAHPKVLPLISKLESYLF